MAKKIFILSLVIFVLAFGALLVQKFFLGGSFDQEEAQTETGVEAEEGKKTGKEIEIDTGEEAGTGTGTAGEVIEEDSGPMISNAQVKQLASGGVLGATLDPNSRRVYYYQNQRFMLTDFDADSRSSVGAYPFEEVSEVKFSADAQNVMVKSQGEFFYFSISQNNAQGLKGQVDFVEWFPLGDKIVYKYFNQATGERTVDMANADGSDWKSLASGVPYRYVDLAVHPRGSRVCFFQTPDAFTETRLECVDPEGEDLKTIYQGSFGADYLFSPNGDKILVSFVQEKLGNRLSLSVMNKNGGELTALNFPTTVKKCVWSKKGNHVYCAMVSGITEDTVLPNDWQSGKLNTADTFWRINLDDGKKERIVDLENLAGSWDAVNLFLDQDEEYLFFIDRKEGDLFRINL